FLERVVVVAAGVGADPGVRDLAATVLDDPRGVRDRRQEQIVRPDQARGDGDVAARAGVGSALDRDAGCLVLAPAEGGDVAPGTILDGDQFITGEDTGLVRGAAAVDVQRVSVAVDGPRGQSDPDVAGDARGDPGAGARGDAAGEEDVQEFVVLALVLGVVGRV